MLVQIYLNLLKLVEGGKEKDCRNVDETIRIMPVI
jgi:hypothetical protein